MKLHNKKLISSNNHLILPCSYRKTEECPLEGKWRANDVVYKCIASATGFPNKFYLGTAQGELKNGFTIIICLSRKRQNRMTAP